MPHAIYPKEWADEIKERAGQKYQPCNGTEGDIFISSWCSHCARDKSLSEGKPLEDCSEDETCDIVTRAMVYRPEEAEYPIEWQYGADGQPKCTAFVPRGEPIPVPRCDRTIDMFGEE